MKMTQDKFHSELRSVPLIAKILTLLVNRRTGVWLLSKLSKLVEGKVTKGLVNKTLYIKSQNEGPDIRVRVYRPENNAEKLPVLLYLHGGGYSMDNPETYALLIEKFIETRPCVIVAPDYRKSLTAPYPAGFNDCYDVLLWVRDHAEAINGDANNIMLAGHSAGGGLTAAVTLKARDTKDVKIAFQMPIFPMIDDRQTTESSQFESPIWGKVSNELGWKMYLKTLHESAREIPTYAAAARNTDYSDFPPTITYVGGIDPFRDDTRAYVESLKQADIPVAYTEFDGCYHGFELICPNTQVANEALRFTYENFARYYDQYLER